MASRRLATLGFFVLSTVGMAAAPPDREPAGARPIGGALGVLEAHCVRCHKAGKAKGGLDLSTREALLKGGKTGPAVVPGAPSESLLRGLIAHEAEPHMPQKGEKLSAEAVSQIAGWIEAGAPYDRPLVDPSAATPAKGEGADFWAFRPLVRAEPPAVVVHSKAKTPVDRFLLAAMAETGLAPSPRASPRTLLRRLSFDLIGLPPTPEEIDAFEADATPDAFAKQVDRLLADPRYGERWGRHWLDLARYADSNGYEGDEDRPTAYPYRDFVIDAFNDDFPFDTFARWQIAGDELAPGDPRAVVATGFCTAGPFLETKNGTPAEREQYRYDELDDVLATTSSAFLGLTVACARCHDHKYDPIPQVEYYRLLSAFTTSKRDERSVSTPGADKALVLTDAQAEPVPSFLLGRGDPARKLGEVEPGFLSVLTAGDPPKADRPAGATTTFRRAALANWLTDVDGGAGRLLARVIVNRLWQHHMGEGIVRTPSDFGFQGERPTHPALLDWLATELIAGGWRLKPIHKLILASAAYAQDSAVDEVRVRIDPENRRLGRRRPARLEAEALRDAVLFVSGSLDARRHGPAIKPALPEGAMAGRNKDDKVPRPKQDGPEQWRRSIYLFAKRSIPTPALEAFDAPDAAASCGRRPISTVATQALVLLNDPAVREQAARFASRVERDAGPEIDARILRAYRLALGRPPSVSESERACAFLAGRGENALVDFCHVLLGLNEFAYVD